MGLDAAALKVGELTKNRALFRGCATQREYPHRLVRSHRGDEEDDVALVVHGHVLVTNLSIRIAGFTSYKWRLRYREKQTLQKMHSTQEGVLVLLAIRVILARVKVNLGGPDHDTEFGLRPGNHVYCDEAFPDQGMVDAILNETL